MKSLRRAYKDYVQKHGDINAMRSMKLHEVLLIKPKGIEDVATDYYSVMRVPGGWIYKRWDNVTQSYDNDTFVPFA